MNARKKTQLLLSKEINLALPYMEKLFTDYINTRNVKPKTVENYKKLLVNLHRKLMGDQNPNTRKGDYLIVFKSLDPSMEWVMDTQRVGDVLKDLSIGTIKGYYSILAPLLLFMNKPEVSKIYSDRLQQISLKMESESKKQVIKKPRLLDNWVSFDKILEKYYAFCQDIGNMGIMNSDSSIHNINAGFIATSILLLFYPRRIGTLEFMKVVQKGDPTTLDTKFNYILCSKRGDKSMIVFNVYKTSTTYGQQSFTIEKRLSILIYNFIKNRKKVIGMPKDEIAFLLQKTIGKTLVNESYSSPAISLLVKQFLESELKIKNITPSDLRTIYISDWFSEKVRYISEIEAEAYKLGNSADTFTKEYVKRPIN